MKRDDAALRQPAEVLDLADTVHREWDIVMTREQRWRRVSAGITDPDEVTASSPGTA